MKFVSPLCAGLVLSVLASTAQAQGPRLVACYKQETVPAKYEITKTLVKAAERKYVKRNNRIELLEYPAVYKENKKLIKPSYEVMKEIPCK